ncbi:nitroreductase family protein, partial [Sutterella wadsworthensis]
AGTMGQSCYLAAASLGLAGCIRASFDHDELRKAMNLDERFEPIVLFTCGRPLSSNSRGR